LPISLALVAVDESFRITRIGSLDRGEFRPHKITQDFWQTWLGRQRPTMVTFNGRGFDLPILEHAAFRYGISIPEWFSQQGPSYTQSRNRYNTQSHFDIMDFLTNFGAMRFTGGLNLAATLLGKPGKMETKGSMVQDLWDQGKKLEIDDYCICDSLDTYFAFLRSKVLQGKLTLAQEAKVVEDAHAFIKEESLRFPILKKYLADFTFWQAPELLDSGFLP
jgi:predicted PolB exonuclease-like 3'-5' exonuclease